MKTKLIKNDMSLAAEIIRKGGLVAVPTETVYGLAGNGLSEIAVHKIYEVKGRPAIKPLSLMVFNADSIEKYCINVPRGAKVLAERFWPGPLTIVLKASKDVPDIVRAGGDTVGLRCPAHPLTLEALRLAGVPFAAPSANPSGAESPKNAEKVMEYFDESIDAVIDGGECGIGFESTIIDMSRTPYKILRQGALPADDIWKALTDSLTLIGITGGTGSGKTTALSVLENMGAKVIDCDKLYHQLLDCNENMKEELKKAFPEVVIDGVLDRKALGSQVFKNAARLNMLNKITHKYVKAEIDSILSDWAISGGSIAAIDAIELFSSGLSDKCKTTVGVVADYQYRINRIIERDKIGSEYAQMRVKAQYSDCYFEENCEHILRNNSTLEEFTNQCNILFKEIL